MGLLSDLLGAAPDYLFGWGTGPAGRHVRDTLDQDVHGATTHHQASSAANSHAAFLSIGGGSSGSRADPQPGLSHESSATVATGAVAPPLAQQQRSRTSFAGKPVRFMGPELGPVRTRLVYQSPDVYDTDISGWDKVMKKQKFAAMFWNEPAMPVHPQIRFNTMQKAVHVKLVDKNTGEVFWDANYSMALVPGLGSPTMKGVLPPDPKDPGRDVITPGVLPLLPGVMKKFWIPESDPGPHLFDLSIQTQENWFNDMMDTPYDHREGFDNLYGHNAHIGIEVYRLPKLEPDKLKNFRGEMSGLEREVGCPSADPRGWMRVKRGKKNSDAPCHNDNLMRLYRKEEDLFYTADDDPIKGNDGRIYYGWMIDKKAKEANDYGYLFKPKIPPLIQPYEPNECARSVRKDDEKYGKLLHCPPEGSNAPKKKKA